METRYPDCISVENMRESDRLTIENYVSGRTLMYRAALGVYRAVSWHGDIVIAVGGGNNGGDGYALACILTREHHPCRIVKLSDKLTENSGFFAEKASVLGVPIEAYSPGAFAGSDMIVDCLLGTGFQGSLREPFLGAVNEINSCGAQVVSVGQIGCDGHNRLCQAGAGIGKRSSLYEEAHCCGYRYCPRKAGGSYLPSR